MEESARKLGPEELGSDAGDSERAAGRSMDSMIVEASGSGPDRIAVSESMLKVCRAMDAGLQLDNVLETILEITLHEMNAQQGSVLLFDEHQDRLEMLASFGLPSVMVEKGYIARKGSIAEWVIDHAEPLILNERAQGTDFSSLGDNRRIVSSMCVPLNASGSVLGTINLNRTDINAGPFAKKDLDTMVFLASQAAISIENSRLHESNLRSERLAAIGQTVAGISHCIKNLLTGMNGGVSLVKLARQNEDWNVLDQSLEVLCNSSSRISSLVFDMLDYSKDREPTTEDVDLAGLMTEIRGVTRQKAAARDCEVLVELAEDASHVQADSHQLFRCLLNLVENGLDASKEGGKVIISSELSSSEGARNRLSTPARAAIIIRVSDEGDGISEENVKQIFEPFFSTKGAKGTGLGLAVTHKIIAEHGGKLEVASEPDEPAVFAIYLPAGTEDISAAH